MRVSFCYNIAPTTDDDCNQPWEVDVYYKTIIGTQLHVVKKTTKQNIYKVYKDKKYCRLLITQQSNVAFYIFWSV